MAKAVEDFNELMKLYGRSSGVDPELHAVIMGNASSTASALSHILEPLTDNERDLALSVFIIEHSDWFIRPSVLSQLEHAVTDMAGGTVQ